MCRLKGSFRSMWYFQWYVRGFWVSWNIADVSYGDFCVSGMVKDVICVVFCVSGTIMVRLSTWVFSVRVCPCVCLILYVSPFNSMMFWSIKSVSIDSGFLLTSRCCCHHLFWVGKPWFCQSSLYFAYWRNIWMITWIILS